MSSSRSISRALLLLPQHKLLQKSEGTARPSDLLTCLTGSSPSSQQVVARVFVTRDQSQESPPPSDGPDALQISRRTVIGIQERFVSQGVEVALSRNDPPTRPLRPHVGGQEEAHLIALARGPAPEGQQRWTLRLLANRMVQ